MRDRAWQATICSQPRHIVSATRSSQLAVVCKRLLFYGACHCRLPNGGKDRWQRERERESMAIVSASFIVQGVLEVAESGG